LLEEPAKPIFDVRDLDLFEGSFLDPEEQATQHGYQVDDFHNHFADWEQKDPHLHVKN
jgi:hypothetical protein